MKNIDTELHEDFIQSDVLTDEQKAIVSRFKKRKENESTKKFARVLTDTFQTSLRLQLGEVDGEPVTAADVIVSKYLDQLMNQSMVSSKDILAVQELAGEKKQNVQVDGELSIEALLFMMQERDKSNEPDQ